MEIALGMALAMEFKSTDFQLTLNDTQVLFSNGMEEQGGTKYYNGLFLQNMYLGDPSFHCKLLKSRS